MIIIVMIVLLSIAIVFCLRNDFINSYFGGYMSITQDPLIDDLYANYKDGYSYSVNPPYGISFKGNLGISDEEGNLLLIIKRYKREEIICVLLAGSATEYPIKINLEGELIEGLKYDEGQKIAIEDSKVLIMKLIDNYKEWSYAANQELKYFDDY